MAREGTLSDSVRHRRRDDDTAGDFSAGVSRGLGREIVRGCVDDDGSAEDFADREAAREKNGVGGSRIPEERRQISGMRGMRTVSWIVVHARVGKRIGFVSGAGGAVVDVKPEYGILTRFARIRQSADFGFHERAEIGAEKTDGAEEIRVLRAALDLCQCMRSSAENFSEAVIGILVHNVPP